MSQRDKTQVSFRAKTEGDRDDFDAALAKQDHIANQTELFRSVMKALKKASDSGRLVEWPIELVLKPKPKR